MQELLWFTTFWQDFLVGNLYYAVLIWIFQLRMTQQQFDAEFQEEEVTNTWFCIFVSIFEFQDELFDRYADIAYLIMFPHLNKWL